MKLQSFGIQYVKVSSSPFLTSKVDDVVNGDDYNRIETIFYNFIIQNNKNFRYYLLLEEVENLKFITNQAINVTNEEILNLLAALKSWDSALTLDRPYREAFNFQDSINILLSEKDGFDKDLLHHFVEFIGRNLTLTTLL